MKNHYTYLYPHPAVTADCAVFHPSADGLRVLLVERGNEPYRGSWALPGGFMNIDETTEQCAVRELQEETGLTVSDIHQIGAFSAVDRDPRERVITVAYYTLLPADADTAVLAGDDAAKARWWPVDALPPLAFDHHQILRQALSLLPADEPAKN